MLKSKKILHKRGLETDLPVLDESEIGFTTDSSKIFFGSEIGNIEIAKKSDIDALLQLIIDGSTIDGGTFDDLDDETHVDGGAFLS